MLGLENIYFCNYSIGEQVYGEVPAVCSMYGKKILLIGGEKALAAGKERLTAALAGSSLEVLDTVVVGGNSEVIVPADKPVLGAECTMTAIHACADYAKKLGADMIFGMGGGKALDISKGAGDAAGLPVFTFPTIAATCAGTTALSVVYKEDGNFDKFLFYDRPARHCFIDLTVISQAPYEYLQAGMGDTIGKFFECHFAARGDKLTHSSALGREISNMCYYPLLEYGVQALKDCKSGKASLDLKQAVLANIVSTGLVSLMVLDDYNCAIAHSVYYGLVLIPGFEEKYLHGNVVAYGVLVQLAVDGDLEEAKKLKAFLTDLEIPTTLKEMGVPVDREYLQAVLKETVTGPDMEHIPYPVSEDMVYEALKIVENL